MSARAFGKLPREGPGLSQKGCLCNTTVLPNSAYIPTIPGQSAGLRLDSLTGARPSKRLTLIMRWILLTFLLKAAYEFVPKAFLPGSAGKDSFSFLQFSQHPSPPAVLKMHIGCPGSAPPTNPSPPPPRA